MTHCPTACRRAGVRARGNAFPGDMLSGGLVLRRPHRVTGMIRRHLPRVHARLQLWVIDGAGAALIIGPDQLAVDVATAMEPSRVGPHVAIDMSWTPARTHGCQRPELADKHIEADRRSLLSKSVPCPNSDWRYGAKTGAENSRPTAEIAATLRVLGVASPIVGVSSHTHHQARHHLRTTRTGGDAADLNPVHHRLDFALMGCSEVEYRHRRSAQYAGIGEEAVIGDRLPTPDSIDGGDDGIEIL
ncbi:hypothetical protein NONI108955_38035 [Nocardia ninae]